MRNNTETYSFITKLKISKGKSMRYTQAELNVALDLVEEGDSFSTVEKITQINKSILAREIRKRKNSKARVKIGEL